MIEGSTVHHTVAGVTGVVLSTKQVDSRLWLCVKWVDEATSWVGIREVTFHV